MPSTPPLRRFVSSDSSERQSDRCELCASDVLAQLNDGLIVLGEDGAVVFSNSAARRCLQNPDPSAAGNPLIGEWTGDDGHPIAALNLPFVAPPRYESSRPTIMRREHAGVVSPWLQVSARQLHDLDYRPDGILVHLVDVNEIQNTVAALKEITNLDPLTRLHNRRGFSDALESAVARVRRGNGRLALAYLDLDGFKAVNDTQGHAAGDQLLVVIADRIRKCLRTDDTVGRMGGDEFCIVLPDLGDGPDISTVLNRVLEEISLPVTAPGMEAAQVSASIGVAILPQDADNTTELTRIADRTMYLAKQRGKGRIEFFDRQVDRTVEKLRAVLQSANEGLRRSEFEVWFQPKVSLRNGTVAGMEALMRWVHPERGVLPATEFLPVIEKSDLMHILGDWVIAEALHCADIWRRMGLEMPVSVNVSPRQLLRPRFVANMVNSLIKFPALPAKRLQLEIIDLDSSNELERIASVLAECSALGVRIAIDDFGGSASSVNYFRQLPTDTLKIGNTCVETIIRDAESYQTVVGIIAMAKAFGLDVVAGGMSSHSHGSRLFAAGCDEVQGYGVAAPMPPRDVAAWCQRFSADPRWTEIGNEE